MDLMTDTENIQVPSNTVLEVQNGKIGVASTIKENNEKENLNG